MMMDDLMTKNQSMNHTPLSTITYHISTHAIMGKRVLKGKKQGMGWMRGDATSIMMGDKTWDGMIGANKTFLEIFPTPTHFIYQRRQTKR